MIVIHSQAWLLIIIDNFIVYWVTVNYGHIGYLDLVRTELGD